MACISEAKNDFIIFDTESETPVYKTTLKIHRYS